MKTTAGGILYVPTIRVDSPWILKLFIDKTCVLQDIFSISNRDDDPPDNRGDTNGKQYI